MTQDITLKREAGYLFSGRTEFAGLWRLVDPAVKRFRGDEFYCIRFAQIVPCEPVRELLMPWGVWKHLCAQGVVEMFSLETIRQSARETLQADVLAAIRQQ